MLPALVATSIVGLLAGLIALWMERTRIRERVAHAEWDAARQYAAAHAFAPSDWKKLEQLVRRHAPGEPYRAVSWRPAFEACVTQEIRRARAADDQVPLERLGGELRRFRQMLGHGKCSPGHQLISTREIEAGTTLYLKLPQQDREALFMVRVARCDDVFLDITFESATADLPPHEPPATVDVAFSRDDDARYEFRAEVLPEQKTPQSWRLFHPEKLARIQKRLSLRAYFPFALHVAPSRETTASPADPSNSRTVAGESLSVGGLSFNSAEAYAPQDLLLIWPNGLLPHPLPEPLRARVLEVHPALSGHYTVRAKFEHLPEGAETAIQDRVFREIKRSPDRARMTS